MTAQAPASSSAFDLNSLRPLAEEFGLTDLEALCRELASAYHIATFGLFAAKHGDLSLVPPQLRDFIESEPVQRRLRISRLHAALTIELAAQVDDPIIQCPKADKLRKALLGYGTELGWHKPPVPGKKRRSRTNRFVVALAPAWRRLTGEEPKAWEIDDRKGGRFLEFACAACDFFKLDRPPVSTMREGYAPRAKRKPNKVNIG